MGGTRSGGIKASATNKEKYGADYYAQIGFKGGRATGTRGGFAANPELAKRAGRLGGSRSKRGSEQEIRWVLVHKPTGDIVGEYPFKTVADKKRAELYGDKAYEYEAVRKKKGD